MMHSLPALVVYSLHCGAAWRWLVFVKALTAQRPLAFTDDITEREF